MLINMSVIRMDGSTQVRVKIDEAVVTEYAQMMLNGIVFDPVVVFNDGRYLWLADGFHRVQAAIKNDFTQIDATVKMGSQDDAKLYAYAANGHRGISLTPEDLKKIIFDMETHPVTKTWTVKQIARHIGKSEATVYRLKRVRRSYPERPARLPQLEAPTEAPEPPTEDVKELADTITTLAEENEILRDRLLIVQSGLEEFEQVDMESRLNVLRKRISDLEMEVRVLTESRDFIQNKNAELIKTIKSLKFKIARLQNAPSRLGKVA
jgi:ParB-like chromosome segregation protein Spo0J